jgi:hypothetical protein
MEEKIAQSAYHLQAQPKHLMKIFAKCVDALERNKENLLRYFQT